MIGAAALVVMGLLGACGGDDDGSTGEGGSGAGTSTNTDTNTGTNTGTNTNTNTNGEGGAGGGVGGAGGGEGGAGGAGGGNTAQAVNGCTIDTATDMTNSAAVSIAFGGAAGQTYNPKCLLVAAGTVVTFNGSFQNHPLQGGEVENGTSTPATTGPFAQVTNTGTTKAFTLDAAGTYPYYCVPHAANGMNGAIYVQQ
ncbi:Hypothetical protein CAP_8385 [Chondromyces apiculatus DSM 436]|uniref:Blue (type 1) copper domain-containing protein n=1 Tax=Chondromyces apiculatus DSM 436 TaxID=1192034 RepID=A0A017SWI3_9BACT|nr:Hypothetical protein CAP_8385 [Chondromyces apiculatus DSM 436]